VTLAVALVAVLAVVLSGRHKWKSAPDRNEFADLRDEVAELRAEVERMKADRSQRGSTDIK
jgi:ubiquinone biosynthesis protein UbiJ